LAVLPAALGGAVGWTAESPPAASPTRRVEVLSEPYTIDRIYKSMAGPEGQQMVRLWPEDPPELLWITGYRVVVVGADGKSPVSQEFMCHNNLDFNPIVHAQLFGSQATFSSRLFTLSQGQFAVDLPAGFGLPVMSNEPLYLSTQVLNHNRKDINIQVRHKVGIDFVRDKEAPAPLKALFPAAAFVVALLEGKDGHFGTAQPTEAQKHASCLPGQQAPDSKYGQVVFTDGQGRKATGHWVVPRGREERHTLVTPMMRLPYDTTIHFVGVHLHPFATSLELRDLTTGKTVFKSRARGPKQGIGLDHVDAFSSAEGIPVSKDHEYELVSLYDNTSDTDQDAMATMFFYLADKAFQKPALAR
jgi:hypothetical protein